MIPHETKKNPLTSAGIEPTTSGFERPLFYRLSNEARWEQVLGDNGGNCLAGWLVGRSVICWMVDWSVGWLVD